MEQGSKKITDIPKRLFEKSSNTLYNLHAYSGIVPLKHTNKGEEFFELNLVETKNVKKQNSRRTAGMAHKEGNKNLTKKTERKFFTNSKLELCRLQKFVSGKSKTVFVILLIS